MGLLGNPGGLLRNRFWVLAIATLGVLVGTPACGGGGGSSTPTPPPPGPGNTTPFVSPPNDALFAQQWHLDNTGQVAGATAGQDARVRLAWETHTVTGTGVRIMVIDDGLEIAHPDLAANVVTAAGAHLDFADNDGDPTSTGEDAHGTACAGLAAGVGHNSIGVSGVAPRAQLAGARAVGTAATNAQIATAMTHLAAQTGIYSMSYGPSDHGIAAPTSAEEWAAVDTGLATGRGGLGAIYSRSCGNGGAGNNTGPMGNPANTATPVDNSGLDELGSHRGVISVGAVGADGVRANYSERGANVLIVAPSEGTTAPALTTTDLSGAEGYEAPAGDYTSTFNGTSAACPVLSGCVALILQARPQLTWRDVREIIAKSARQNDATNGEWFANGAGIQVSHNYGFGTIDANAAVAMAQTWTLLPADQAPVVSPTVTPGVQAIPDGGQSTSSHTFAASGRTRIEHVIVTINVDSERLRDLSVRLTSPAGTTVNLLEQATATALDTSFTGTLRLGATLFLDEGVDGQWTLTVTDENNAANTDHTITNWTISVWAH